MMGRSLLVTIIASAAASSAAADPCEGPLPTRVGETFNGVVQYIVDGDGLCVGTASDPNTWIEVRLADFDAFELSAPQGPAAKNALERITFRRTVRCVVVRGRNGRTRSHDRVFASCALNGRGLGDLMRAARVSEGGN